MIKKYLRARRIKKLKEEVLIKRKWFENSVKEMKQIFPDVYDDEFIICKEKINDR